MSVKNFSDRHIGVSTSDLEIMLEKIQVSSIAELIQQTVPDKIFLDREMNLPSALTETRCLEQMKSI